MSKCRIVILFMSCFFSNRKQTRLRFASGDAVRWFCASYRGLDWTVRDDALNGLKLFVQTV